LAAGGGGGGSSSGPVPQEESSPKKPAPEEAPPAKCQLPRGGLKVPTLCLHARVWLICVKGCQDPGDLSLLSRK